MKLRIFVFLLTIFIGTVHSQTTFEITLGKKNSNQWGYDIVETNDRGFLIAGRTQEKGSDDVLLVALNAKGELLNQKVLGVPKLSDWAKAICLSKKNELALCGISHGNLIVESGNIQNAFFAQVDQNLRDIHHPIAIGGNESNTAKNIIELQDGNFLLSMDNTFQSEQKGFLPGIFRSDFQLRKLDPTGNELWLKAFPDLGEGFGQSLIQSRDGSIYFTGMRKVKSGKGRDVFIIKLKEDGSIIWTKTVNKEAGDKSTARRIIEDKDGNLLLVGQFTSGGSSSPMLLNMNVEGEIIFQKNFDMGRNTEAVDILQLSSGELILTGHSYGFRPFIIHLRSTGQDH